jgi:hypothetical protein
MIDNHVIVDCVFSVDESSRALPLLTAPLALLAVSTRYIERCGIRCGVQAVFVRGNGC